MRNNIPLNPKYSGLTATELVAAKEAVLAEIKKLTPVRDKLEELEGEEYEISRILSQVRVDNGEADFGDLSSVLFGAAGTLDIYRTLEKWLKEVSSSTGLVLTSLEDGPNGSSDFSLAPFTILLQEGSYVLDEALISSVEEVSELVVRAEQRLFGETVFHIGLDSRLFLIIKNISPKGSSPVNLRATISEYPYSSRSGDEDKSSTIREAFVSLPRVVKSLNIERKERDRQNTALWSARVAMRKADEKAKEKADKKDEQGTKPRFKLFGRK